MDNTTSEIRYQHWVQIMQDWSNSGQTKHSYCQENGISEKQFYYYQHRIRNIIAKQAECRQLPGGNFGLTTVTESENHPPIVKLRIPEIDVTNGGMVNFIVNGMSLSVPENIPATFLTKLLEAANHGTR